MARSIARWLPALVLVLIAASSQAATVIGTFKYKDKNAGDPKPIRFAKVEIWHRGIYFWNTWAHVGTRNTNDNGSMSFTDGRTDGTYGVRVFAENYAAVVYPNDAVHTFPFHREPGQPAQVRNLVATSAASVLDFSYTFEDDFAPQHYNLAETVRLGFDFASTRRDPRETDAIPRVPVQPTSASISPTGTFYNAPVDTLVIRSDHVFEDYVVLHEYAHFLEEQISSFAPIPSNHDGCSTRAWPGGPLINNLDHAWMEAFANFFASAVARSAPPGSVEGDPGFGTARASTLENPPTCSALGQSGVFGTVSASMIENFVGASLWDLFDTRGETSTGFEAHDLVAGEDRAIFQIFDRELDVAGVWPTIFHFRSAWIARGLDRSALDCILSRYGILSPSVGCKPTVGAQLVGDFNGDRKTDVALTGAPSWGTLPTALSLWASPTLRIARPPTTEQFLASYDPASIRPVDGFQVTNEVVASLPTLAANTRAAKLTADFDGDGKSDVAVVGGGGSAIPLAFSNGDGSFRFRQLPMQSFPVRAAGSEVAKLVGDFDGNGHADLALTGAPGWTTLPMALSIGNAPFNSFAETNEIIGEFAAWASNPRAAKLVGDFNFDGRSDIALTGPSDWGTLPVAFSNGNGTFTVTNHSVGSFASWAATAGAVPLAGDFDGDGSADVALTGAPGWATLPVALSWRDGNFTVINVAVGEFAAWAAMPGVAKLTGDFNGDRRTDIALVGGPGWGSIPVALSNGNGTFTVQNVLSLGEFGGWAASPGAVKLAGDVNGDGRTDILLTGPAGWGTLPVAISNGDGSFRPTNHSVGEFGSWAAATR